MKQLNFHTNFRTTDHIRFNPKRLEAIAGSFFFSFSLCQEHEGIQSRVLSRLSQNKIINN